MNARVGAITSAAAALVLGFVLGDALSEPDRSLEFGIESESGTIMPLLPLHVVATMKNISAEPKEVLVSEPAALIEYAYSEDGPWRPYRPDGIAEATPTPPSKRRVDPGESLTWSMILDINAFNTREGIETASVVRAHVSSVFVRARILGAVTSPTKVAVHVPSGRDMAALIRLGGDCRKCMELLSEYAIYRRSPQGETICRAFASEYRDTTYGMHVRLGMALADLHDRKSSAERDSLQTLEEIGNTGPPALRARAWLYAAKATGARTVRGREYLQRAASEKGGGVFVRTEIQKLTGMPLAGNEGWHECLAARFSGIGIVFRNVSTRSSEQRPMGPIVTSIVDEPPPFDRRRKPAPIRRDLMKLSTALVAALICSSICAIGRDRNDRASQLMSAIGIPLDESHSGKGDSLFATSDTVRANGFQLEKKHKTSLGSVSTIQIEISDKEGSVIAVARMLETDSPGAARRALAEELANNSMPMELLILRYEVQKIGIGDFCVLERTRDEITKEFKVDRSAIHFVRGAKAVSLHSRLKRVDIRDAAMALDRALSRAHR